MIMLRDHLYSSKLAIVNNGDILLLRRHTNSHSHGGLLELPGGKMNRNESSIGHAVIREVREETGIRFDSSDISEPRLANEYTISDGRHAGKYYQGYGAIACVTSREIILSREHEEGLWMPPESALIREDVSPRSQRVIQVLLPTLLEMR